MNDSYQYNGLRISLPDMPHPWQHGPTELIVHGIEHMHAARSDFDRRIAFLQFDLGVETLFKTFLELPEGVTGTKMSFDKRQKAAQGSFHEVVYGVGAAAGNRIKATDLSHVQHYHSIRNSLYHRGNGITVSAETVSEYGRLVVTLLLKLLNVNLSEMLEAPLLAHQQEVLRQAEIQNEAAMEQQFQMRIAAKKAEVEKARHELLIWGRLVLKLLAPSALEMQSAIAERAALIAPDGLSAARYHIAISNAKDELSIRTIALFDDMVSNCVVNTDDRRRLIAIPFEKKLQILSTAGSESYSLWLLDLLRNQWDEGAGDWDQAEMAKGYPNGLDTQSTREILYDDSLNEIGYKVVEISTEDVLNWGDTWITNVGASSSGLEETYKRLILVGKGITP